MSFLLRVQYLFCISSHIHVKFRQMHYISGGANEDAPHIINPAIPLFR